MIAFVHYCMSASVSECFGALVYGYERISVFMNQCMNTLLFECIMYDDSVLYSVGVYRCVCECFGALVYDCMSVLVYGSNSCEGQW